MGESAAADGMGPVRIRFNAVVAGSAGVMSSVERIVTLTDTHIHVSMPSRVHAGYSQAQDRPEVFREQVEGEDLAFEIGSVPVTFESGFLRSKLRIGDLDLRVRPPEKKRARQLAELAAG